MGSTMGFSFPDPPEFVDEDFYVGLAQLAVSVTYRPMGRFVENPQRQNTFFAAPISGGDLSEIEDFFNLKFGIEAIVEGTGNNTITLTSGEGTDDQEVCIHTPIDDITYATTGATGATVTGLPDGVSGDWSDNVVNISGTPTEAGSFDYTITLTGGCGEITAQGSITVIDESVSVTDHQGGEFVIYPNPVNDLLTMELFATEASQHTWRIYDTKGRLIMSGSDALLPGKNAIIIETDYLLSGLYTLQSNLNGTMNSVSFIKK